MSLPVVVPSKPKTCNAVVIGASTGGHSVLATIFSLLPATFPVPVIVVIHLHPHSDSQSLANFFANRCRLPVKEAEEKEPLLPGRIYLAPANYHLLVEPDRRLALSVDPRVKYSRPSVDVLFESAAEAYPNSLVGIVLTGASSDGANGLSKIKALGGYTIVQDPKTAEATMMPESALLSCQVDRVLVPDEIGRLLASSVHNRALRF